jgi:hypothetical protein
MTGLNPQDEQHAPLDQIEPDGSIGSAAPHLGQRRTPLDKISELRIEPCSNAPVYLLLLNYKPDR